MIILSGLIVFYSFLTIQRNEDWKNDFALFSSAERIFPRNVKVLSNLSYYLSQEGKIEKAARKLQKAIEIYPSFADSYVNLGNIFLYQKDDQKAMEEYQRALQIVPSYEKAKSTTGFIFLNRQEIDQTRQIFIELLDKNPQQGAGWYGLSRISYLRKDKKWPFTMAGKP